MGKLFAFVTDADFTYPAEFIPKMIEILELNPDVGMSKENALYVSEALGSSIERLRKT